jgi:hypothetical protein
MPLGENIHAITLFNKMVVIFMLDILIGDPLLQCVIFVLIL